MAPVHIEVRTALIDKYQLVRVKPLAQRPPFEPRLFISLTRLKRLFFS